MRFICLLLIIWGCTPSKKAEHTTKEQELCVTKIDSLTYQTAYIVHLRDKRGNQIKLLSKKENPELCEIKLQVDRCYKMSTYNLSSTSGFTDTGFRFGQYDIYIDGILVFSQADRVVSSHQIKGLCFYPVNK